MCGGGMLDGLKKTVKSSFTGKGLTDTLFTGGFKTQEDLAKLAVGQGKRDLEDAGIKKPHVDAIDPEAERLKAAATATAETNARISFMRKAQRQNNLFTGGGAAASGSGRSTLGV